MCRINHYVSRRKYPMLYNLGVEKTFPGMTENTEAINEKINNDNFKCLARNQTDQKQTPTKSKTGDRAEGNFSQTKDELLSM